ncbi:protein slit-like [Zophobas morio]|uniref:protein slit-like n=1 Tax=Zophobas morio TaxID=2755281 RepID=UPI003082D4CF
MIHIVLLILVLLTETHAGCPLICNCTENSINCVSKNLEKVPSFESLDNNPLIIDLSGNSISLIGMDHFSFDKSEEVKEVFLNNSGVVAIEEAAFEELENLQELYLSDNLLNAVPENFLIHNENMVLLDLSTNYFTDMPKIKSKSLEVFTIASSGVSNIPNGALDGLPNLRILLLSQNNLKTINPVIFDRMSNLFFISVAFNPWDCNCKTIKLFDYLMEKRFVDLTETVQCRNENRMFVDIYREDGVVAAFKDQCDNFVIMADSEEPKEMEISLKNLDVGDSEVLTTATSEKLSEEPAPDIYFSDFSYIVILGISVFLSLLTGGVCGSYLTFRYMKRNITPTESTKELLCRLEDNVVRYSF